MKKSKAAYLAGGLLLLFMITTSFAEDYWHGPSRGTWHRDDTGTTWQRWDIDNEDISGFSYPNAMGNIYVNADHPMPKLVIPDSVISTYPDGSTVGNTWAYDEIIYVDDNGLFQIFGILTAGYGDQCRHSLRLEIPNSTTSNPEKWLYLQVTSDSFYGNVRVLVPGPNGALIPTDVTFKYSDWHEIETLEGSNLYTWGNMLAIAPNPSFEVIELEFAPRTRVEEIVVDTICWDSAHPVGVETRSWGDIKSLFR